MLGIVDYSEMPLRRVYPFFFPAIVVVGAIGALRIWWQAMKHPVGFMVGADSLVFVPLLHGDPIALSRFEISSVVDRGDTFDIMYAGGRLRVTKHLYTDGDAILDSIRKVWGSGVVVSPDVRQS